MAFFNDTYCQLCERFITEGEWNKHPNSSRHKHREINGYWPACFPQKKLTRDEGNIIEKAFWEIIFGCENSLAVYGFLKTYFKLVTNLKDYVKDDDDDDDFRYHYRDNMIAQFKQDFWNKSFSHQD